VHLQETKIRHISFGIAFSIVLAMAIVFLYDYYFHLNLYKLGVFPRKWEGLLGVLTSPFIHSTASFSHLLNNSLPMFVLTWLLFYSYRTVAAKVFIFIYFATGILVWLFGRESYHIGMSGVIYGLTSFLIVSGFFRKNMRIAGISLLVIFLYGSLIWGVVPLDPSISWEGHFFGFLSGMIMAGVYRKAGPQPEKFRYEVEEDLGFEYEDEFWLEKPCTSVTDTAELNNEQPIIINYTFIPTSPKVFNPPEFTDFEEE
jgi:membrane associated rhomboid family serine protease